MYFKNDLGTVKIEGNKVITETRFSITTIEVKAIAYIKQYYLMEVAALKQMDENQFVPLYNKNKRSYNISEVIVMADILSTDVDGVKMAFRYDKNYDRFHDAYHKYVKTNIVIDFSENNLLRLMHRNKINYFRVPKEKSLVGYDIVFIFEKETVEMNEHTMITLYKFVEVQKY